jgi:hypothetical protein
VTGACLFVGLTCHVDARTASRLLPSQPLSLTTLVGTVNWMILLFGMTTSHVSVFMPLVAQVLYGVSPLAAGYFTALLSASWTTLALCSAHLQERKVRVVILLGPLLVLCGAVGMGVGVDQGSLMLLGGFLAMIGAGIGLCFAHINSWAIAAARAGEGTLTTAALPTLNALGIAFGAATAGLTANAAGLGTGVALTTVAAATPWIYRLGTVAPAVAVILALRLLWLHRERVSVDHPGLATGEASHGSGMAGDRKSY